MTGWGAEWAGLVCAVVGSHRQKHRPHPAVCFKSVMFEFLRLTRVFWTVLKYLWLNAYPGRGQIPGVQDPSLNRHCPFQNKLSQGPLPLNVSEPSLIHVWVGGFCILEQGFGILYRRCEAEICSHDQMKTTSSNSSASPFKRGRNNNKAQKVVFVFIRDLWKPMSAAENCYCCCYWWKKLLLLLLQKAVVSAESCCCCS